MFLSFFIPCPVPRHSRAVRYHRQQRHWCSGCCAFSFGCKFRLVPIHLLFVLGVGGETQTKDAQKENITILFRFPVSFQHLAKVMKYHWIGGLVRPLHPVQVSASKVKSAPAIQNHHHHHHQPPAFGVNWQETAHQGDSRPTSAHAQASLSLRLQGSWAGKQRPPGLPGLLVCLAWILEAAGIWSVWPVPSCSL